MATEPKLIDEDDATLFRTIPASLVSEEGRATFLGYMATREERHCLSMDQERWTTAEESFARRTNRPSHVEALTAGDVRCAGRSVGVDLPIIDDRDPSVPALFAHAFIDTRVGTKNDRKAMAAHMATVAQMVYKPPT